MDEIKRDMERPVPMDRLLCGDVGYGKTEVAFRAMMKCVLDGKQAAVLSFCLMVFCLLYIPCAAALATIRKESKSWLWMFGTAAFQLVVAWLITLIVYQIGLLII